jgi:hypothetical protein
MAEMRSLKQIEASRRNGARSKGPKTPRGKQISAANSAFSTGPVTPAGKAVSSRNALRHGLLASSVVLPSEVREGFEDLLADLHAELLPETPIEHRLVEVLAVIDWRRMRLWCIEMGQVAHELHAQERANDPIVDAEASQIPFMATSIAFGTLITRNRGIDSIKRHEADANREYRRTLAFYHSLRAARLNPGNFSRKQTEPTSEQIPEIQ